MDGASILDTIFGVCTMVRSGASVLSVVKTFHRNLISPYTFDLYTMVRNLTKVLCVVLKSLESG